MSNTIAASMDCTSCGFSNPSRGKFCNECGATLAERCAGYGTELPPAAKFCGECGASSATAAVSSERSPRTYTPKHLADKILQSKSALEGERKQVTVLFADVQGSMELSEQLDAEQWHRILERFFEILTEGVHRFEGTVNQYTGDGIMALFGAPIAHEDHAQRACYAALHLRDAIGRYATELKREHGLGFSTRMGIHSGEVVVGKIGDDLRMDYTSQCHTVGLAQRMESLAEPNGCYLTATTAALAGGYFELDDLGNFRVKGVTEPVRVHRLAGLGAARTRFDVSRARGLARFVGRAADLRTLDDALEQTSAGNGQVVGVVAEAGTGKSRLCFEFLERCRARAMQVYEGRAVAHGRNIPLLPILEGDLGEIPVIVGHTQRALAYAQLAAERPSDAIEPARAALGIFRRIERNHEGMAATLLAEALLAAGDLTASLSAADEAIAVCRRSQRGNFEAIALGIRARERLLCEAQRGYTESGAIGHAERLTRELP